MELTIAIPLDEWINARRLLPLLQGDDRTPLGQLRLRSDGTRRRWEATDSFRAAAIDGGADAATYELSISASLLAFAPIAAEHSDEAQLQCVEEDGTWRLGVVGPGGSLFIDDLGFEFPDLDSTGFAEYTGGATVTLSATSLFDLVGARCARQLAGDGEDESIEMPPYWLRVEGAELQAGVFWSECGFTCYTIPVEEAAGGGTVSVNPRYLESLIRLFEPEDRIEVHIPPSSGKPLKLVGDHCQAVLMPMKDTDMQRRELVEATIEQVAGHLAVVRDKDGDYPLRRHTTPVFGRLSASASPALFQVFAVLLDDVDGSPELFTELNDLNSTIGFARLFHVERQVLAEVELVASSLDPEELETAIDRILEIAQRIMPMLAAVFGGTEIEDPMASRRRLYHAALIDAEVSPGNTVALNGPGAVADWPFPATVHVITGWNPQGVALDPSLHQDINVRIAEDILRRGGRFVHGHGRSPDGEHTEPSLIAYGLDRQAAIMMGRRASQDSIFEIDADEVRLVSCVDVRVDNWPRHD